METSSTTMAPLLLRSLITSLFFYADKSLLFFSLNSKILQFLRHLLSSSFLFLIRILPSLSHSPRKTSRSRDKHAQPSVSLGDSAIARALSHLLSLLNDIPVSSRKYEVVRCLAERLIDDNLREGFESLRHVNRNVLSAAFERTLHRLEATVLDGQERCGDESFGPASVGYGVGRILQVVSSIIDGGWARFMKPRDHDASRSGLSAEKLAAELLWLGQKLAACGYSEEAVCIWASASNLGWLSLSAEPRLQGSLVKVSAFLFKQAKDIGRDGRDIDISMKEERRETNMKMLMSWLPLLCRASNGTDTPILSSSERAELEKVLELTIDMLEEEEQEKVLSLWIHHFTYSSSSDWPDLNACYTRWCTASRKLLLLQ